MLGRAKNVEFSMRLAAIEEYGDNLRISAPQEIAGMTEEARERIAQMAGADGQILLLAWSEEKMRPVAFLYTEGTYTVRFTYDPDTESTAWQVYRANRVLEFGQPGA